MFPVVLGAKTPDNWEDRYETNCAKQLIASQLPVHGALPAGGEAQAPRWRVSPEETQHHGTLSAETPAVLGPPAQPVLGGSAVRIVILMFKHLDQIPL